MLNPREEFLIEVYRQCSAHVNRHVLIPWQSVGVVGAALAVFLIEGKLQTSSVELDFLMTLAVVLCCWLAAHLYDANNWFDRNILIIANVEKQFLNRADLQQIHPFFERHRSERSGKVNLLRHFRIQFGLTSAVLFIVLAFHLVRRVLVDECWPNGWTWTLPYIAFVVGIACVLIVREVSATDTRDLVKRAPGKAPME